MRASIRPSSVTLARHPAMHSFLGGNAPPSSADGTKPAIMGAAARFIDLRLSGWMLVPVAVLAAASCANASGFVFGVLAVILILAIYVSRQRQEKKRQDASSNWVGP